jgi:hypothetical protein
MDGIENMKVCEIEPTLACRWMQGRGTFGRMGVQGDGSCFFHSVCALMNLKDYLHVSEKQQKKIALEFRCSFSERFDKKIHKLLSKKSNTSKSFEEQSSGFCSLKTWADEVMIRYASMALDINLIFLDLKSGKAYCGVHGETAHEEFTGGIKVTQKTGLIAWVNRRHFEPIVRIDDQDEGILTTLFEPDNKEDLELINTIMREYVESCNL